MNSRTLAKYIFLTKANGDSRKFLGNALFVALSAIILASSACFYLAPETMTLAEQVTLGAIIASCGIAGWMGAWAFYLSLVDSRILRDLDADADIEELHSSIHSELDTVDPRARTGQTAALPREPDFTASFTPNSLIISPSNTTTQITVPVSEIVEIASSEFGALIRTRKPGGLPKNDTIIPLRYPQLDAAQLKQWALSAQIYYVMPRVEFRILRKVFRNAQLPSRVASMVLPPIKRH